MDDRENIMENKSTKIFNCLFVIAILWMVMILYIFTVISDSDNVDTKSRKDLDYRQHQSISNFDNNTSYIENIYQIQLSRDPSGHYMYKGQVSEEDVIYIIDTGVFDMSIPEHVTGRL